MADVHAYLKASEETDASLSNMRVYAGQIEDHEREPNPDLTMLLVGDAIVMAIREVGTRLDFVLRDLEQRRR